MTCHDCAKAAAQVWHGFTAACEACRARMASRDPTFHRARTTKRQDPAYAHMLKTMVVTHEQAKAAHTADAINHAKLTTRETT